MRVIEPSSTASKSADKIDLRPKKSNKRRILVSLIVVLAAGVLIWFLFVKDASAPVLPGQSNKKSNQTANNNIAGSNVGSTGNKTKLKTFTSDEFRNLYNSFAYPNTTEITTPSEITGNPQADARIRSLAEARGYRMRSIPVASIKKIGDPNLTDDDLLQQKALDDWQVLKDEAKKDGVPLRIASGYRSPEFQKNLFMQRLGLRGVTAAQVAAGQADAAVQFVLKTTAIPSYSRHHTGYTIDLQCDDGELEQFENSKCFSWISKNNYEKAKIAGWIPSYPPGTTNQGPEPEAWEYVWVGRDATYE